MNYYPFLIYLYCLNNLLISCSLMDRSPSSRNQAEFLLDSHSFAQSIISQIPQHNTNNVNYVTPKLLMAFDYENLDLVSSNGFLNLFTTKTSNASANIRKRTKTELAMVGLPLKLGVGPHELRPKYSYINLAGRYDTIMVKQYGDLVVEFRKEVHSRSSFALADTLNGGAAHQVQKVTQSFIDSIRGEWGVLDYLEGQIWGRLSLDDVKYFLVDEDKFELMKDKLVSLSKEFGFGIKTYKPYSKRVTQYKMTKLKVIQKPKAFKNQKSLLKIYKNQDKHFFMKIASDKNIDKNLRVKALFVLNDLDVLGREWDKISGNLSRSFKNNLELNSLHEDIKSRPVSKYNYETALILKRSGHKLNSEYLLKIKNRMETFWHNPPKKKLSPMRLKQYFDVAKLIDKNILLHLGVFDHFMSLNGSISKSNNLYNAAITRRFSFSNQWPYRQWQS